LLVTVATAACALDDQGLLWSIRGGRVGDFALHGAEVITVGDELAVYDKLSGRRLRSAKLPSDFGNITLGQLGPGLTVSDGSIVFGWYDFATEVGTLFCFDVSSLTKRWEWHLAWPWHERSLRPTLSTLADQSRAYAAAVGKHGDNLFAFRLSDGALVWSRIIERFPAESALALAGQRLLVRSKLWGWATDLHEQLDAVHAVDGQRLWRTWLTGEAKYHVGPPLIRGDVLFTTTRRSGRSGNLFSVRLTDGRTARADIPTAGAPLATHGDIVYLGGLPPAAYDVNAGRTVWQASLGGDERPLVPMIAGGAFDPARNSIYTGDSERYLYVLAAVNGALVRRLRLDTYLRFEIFSPIKALSASYGVRRVATDGASVLVGTVDSSLFVFRADDLTSDSALPTAIDGRRTR
jgi:outer membrane protein assembly factor BamB